VGLGIRLDVAELLLGWTAEGGCPYVGLGIRLVNTTNYESCWICASAA